MGRQLGLLGEKVRVEGKTGGDVEGGEKMRVVGLFGK